MAEPIQLPASAWGAAIRRARGKRITLDEFSARTGLSKTFLSFCERGTRPAGAFVKQLNTYRTLASCVGAHDVLSQIEQLETEIEHSARLDRACSIVNSAAPSASDRGEVREMA